MSTIENIILFDNNNNTDFFNDKSNIKYKKEKEFLSKNGIDLESFKKSCYDKAATLDLNTFSFITRGFIIIKTSSENIFKLKG